MMDRKPDQWSPELVREALVAAMTWVRTTGGVGPGGYRTALPEIAMTMEDRLAAGWDATLTADEAPIKIPASPAEITRHEQALNWIADILLPFDRDMAAAVGAAAVAEASRRSFPRIAQEKGLSRARAYTLRDRGLSILSVQLDRRGVRPWA